MERYQKLYTNAARTILRFAETFGYELPDNDRAEDLLQELVLLKLEGDRQNKTRKYLTEFFRGENRVELTDIAGLDANPEEIVVAREQHEEMWAMVKSLPDKWRKTIEIRYLENDGEKKTHAQIGELLGVTRARVGQQQKEAILRLRDQLAQNV